MINRGDRLAINMVVNAQDDELFGGEVEYVINTLEDCGNTIAAQAAVIERLTKWLHIERSYYLEAGSDIADDVCDYLYHPPTDSTQILDEVRRAEREKCAKVCDRLSRKEKDHAAGYGFGYLTYTADDCAAAIRAME